MQVFSSILSGDERDSSIKSRMLSAKSSPNFLHTHHISSTEPGESKLEPHPTYTCSLSANASSVDLVREKSVKVDEFIETHLNVLTASFKFFIESARKARRLLATMCIRFLANHVFSIRRINYM